MIVYERDGRIADVWGDGDHPLSKGSLCALGSASSELLGSPARLTHPRVRDRARAWREIGWDEALDVLAAKIVPLLETGRSRVVTLAQSASASFGSLLSAERLARALGFGYARRATQVGAGLGALASTTPPPEWPKARSIVLVVADPASTEPVTMGWLIDARLRGATLIALDDRRTGSTAKCDAVVPIRPSEAPSLLAALAGALVERGAHDIEALRAIVTDAEDWLRVSREMCGPRAETATGVSAGRISEVAARLAQGFPTLVVVDPKALGEHAETTVRAALGLVSLQGSLGAPGGGLVCLGGGLPRLSAGTDLPLRSVTPAESPEVLLWESSVPPRVEDAWAASLANRAELVVSLSAFPDDVTERATLSLPTALWLEHPGVIDRSTARTIQWHPAAVPAAGESRAAAWIWAALARRLGAGSLFPWLAADQIDHAAMADFFLAQSADTAGCSQAVLDPSSNPAGGVLWPVPLGAVPGFEQGATIRGTWRLVDRLREWPPPEPIVTLGVSVADLDATARRPGAPTHERRPLLEEFGGAVAFPEHWPLVSALSR